MTELISVIMPAFNASDNIREAIRSVIDQTYRHWELIVVDDGSTDNTSYIVKELQITDQRIKYIYQQNGKQGKARNYGIRNSQGNYIAFLDADDLWTSNKLSLQFDRIDSNPEIDLVFSQGYKLEGKLITEVNLIIKDVWSSHDLPIFIESNQIPILSVLVKKEALINVELFEESPEIQNTEDYHLWLKLLNRGYKLRSIQERLFYYRIHSAQKTYQNQNTYSQLFYTYKSIFEYTKAIEIRRLILKRVKWYIFKEQFYEELLRMVNDHFKQCPNVIFNAVLKRSSSNYNKTTSKIVFQLINHCS